MSVRGGAFILVLLFGIWGKIPSVGYEMGFTVLFDVGGAASIVAYTILDLVWYPALVVS